MQYGGCIASHKYSFKSDQNQTELSVKVKEVEKDSIGYTVEYNVLENPQTWDKKMQTLHSRGVLYTFWGIWKFTKLKIWTDRNLQAQKQI